MAKKSFKERSTGQQVVLGAATLVAVAVVVAAQIDLFRRNADEVRGNKLIWHLACLNATAVPAYLKFGRISATDV